MERGVCRFCGQERDLIGAHIISKAIFKRARGNGPALELITTWNGRAGTKSNGFVDPLLTCGDCDNSFSVAENYFADYLATHYVTPGTPLGATTALIDEGYDYAKFKVALLAILWRAHETYNEFFSNVGLDAPTAAKLKRMLENGDPGSRTDFPIYVRRFRSAIHHGALPQLILDPVMAEDDVLELMMLGWQFLICRTLKYGALVLEPGRLVAVDVLLEGSREESDILRVIAAAGFGPAPAV